MIPRHTIVCAAHMAKEGYAEFPSLPFSGDAEAVHVNTDDVYIVRRLGGVYIIPVGTELSVFEWLKNFMIFKKGHGYLGRVHKGFYYNLRALWDGIEDTGVFDSPNVTFVGHSRGGAIASLMALSYFFIYNKKPRVITFGSPRVGNRTWKKNFEQSGIEHVRVALSGDLITKIPVLNYWHVGRLMELSGSGHSITSYIDALEHNV